LQRSAELPTAALPHLDDRQHLMVETDQIELAGLAPDISRQDFKPARLQEVGRESFRLSAALPAQIRHPA
jgi:hypothetical protein